MCSSLLAGSPQSHARERRRAERSGGKESGEEVPRKWACLNLCNFFISALLEWSEILLVKKRERRENYQSIKFHEEQLDSHAWSHSKWIFKLFTFGVRGRVGCVYYQCFNKVPVYFWANFKLKRDQEIAVESTCMLMNQDILIMLPNAHGKS